MCTEFFYERFQVLSMPKISKLPGIKLVILLRERIYFFLSVIIDYDTSGCGIWVAYLG